MIDLRHLLTLARQPTTFTVEITEDVALTDVLDDTFPQPITESFVLTDQAVENSESLQESVALTDVLEGGKYFDLSLTESVGTSDAVTAGFETALTESFGLSDSATIAESASISESFGLTDGVSYLHTPVMTGVLTLPELEGDSGPNLTTGGGTAELDLPMLERDEWLEDYPTGGAGTGSLDLADLNAIAVAATGVSGRAGTAAPELPSIEADAGNSDRTGDGVAILPDLESSAAGITGGSGTGAAELPELTGSGGYTAAGSGPTPGTGYGAGELDNLTGEGEGVTGFFGTGSATLPPLGTDSTAQQATGSGTGSAELPSLEGDGDGYQDDSLADCGGYALLQDGSKVLFQDGSGAAMLQSVCAGSQPTAEGELPIFLPDAIGIGGDQTDTSELNRAAAAVNVRNGGATEYANYNFNSFCTHNGQVFGAGANGIYLLEGSTDNGTNIGTAVKKTDIDFGDSHIKRATDAYIKTRADGDYVFTVIADEVSSSRDVSTNVVGLQTNKTNLPRGLKGRGLGFAVENTDGSHIELDEVELVVDTSTTRRRRQ